MHWADPSLSLFAPCPWLSVEISLYNPPKQQQGRYFCQVSFWVFYALTSLPTSWGIL